VKKLVPGRRRQNIYKQKGSVEKGIFGKSRGNEIKGKRSNLEFPAKEIVRDETMSSVPGEGKRHAETIIQKKKRERFREGSKKDLGGLVLVSKTSDGQERGKRGPQN